MSFKSEAQRNLFDIAACKCDLFLKCSYPKGRKIPKSEHAFMVDQRTDREKLLSVVYWESSKIHSLFVAEWPPSPFFIEFILVIAHSSLGPSSPLPFPDPVVLVRQPLPTTSVWGCLTSAFLGIVNRIFHSFLESGTPFPSPSFPTHTTCPCLRGGSASICAVAL